MITVATEAKTYVNTTGKIVELRPMSQNGSFIPIGQITERMVMMRKPNANRVEMPESHLSDDGESYQVLLDDHISEAGQYRMHLWINVPSIPWSGYGALVKFEIHAKYT